MPRTVLKFLLIASRFPDSLAISFGVLTFASELKFGVI